MFSLNVKAAVAAIACNGTINGRDQRSLLANLIFVYHTMVASESLLRMAIKHSTGTLRAFFERHLKEETGHERWLAEDLASVDIDVKATNPPRLAVEMVGSIYYLIQHAHPAALLGYMVLMECFPVPLEMIEELEREHGKALLRTLRYHAEHDRDHGAEVLRVVDGLPQEQQQLVMRAAVHSAEYFAAAMAAIKEQEHGV